MLWEPIKLKYEEAEYFAGQLRPHERHPRIFIFYVTAFVTSARSITFHLQKQAAKAGYADLYRTLQQAMLSDDLSQFFVELRNEIEKQGHPTLTFDHLTGLPGPSVSNEIWVARAAGTVDPQVSRDPFTFIETMLRIEWDFVDEIATSHYNIRVRWNFVRGPGHEERLPVIETCEKYLDQIWRLLVRMRAEIKGREERPGNPPAAV